MTSVTVTSPQAYNDYQWHHVVAQRRADTAELWVDGVLVGSVAVTGSISNTANLAIGSKDTQNDDFLNSMLDEVRIYMRSFAPDEIEQLYNSNLSRRNSPDEWMFRTKQVGLADDTYSHGISVTNQTPETTIISRTFTIQQPVPPTITLDSPRLAV